MTKHTILFLVTFAIGCIIALAIRTALHQPDAGHDDAVAVPAYAPMVTNSTGPEQTPGNPPATAGHSGHAMAANTAPVQTAPPTPPPTGKAVNSLCAICGMDVDPAIPTATYQGKAIGFGCKACPPKFAADPEKYGPYALRNEQAPE